MVRTRNDAVARNRRLDTVENLPAMPNQLWDAKTKTWVHTAEDMERVLAYKAKTTGDPNPKVLSNHAPAPDICGCTG